MSTAVPLIDLEWHDGFCFVGGAFNYAQMAECGVLMPIPPKGQPAIGWSK